MAQARVVAHQRREEILMEAASAQAEGYCFWMFLDFFRWNVAEVDCQLRVLRQRMDSITELSDELMFQQEPSWEKHH